MREPMQRPAPIHSVRLAGKHWSSPGRDVPAYLAECIDPYLDQVETEREEALARADKAESAWRFANTALEGTQDKLETAQSENQRLGARNAGLLNEVEQLRTRTEKAETNLLASDREWYAKLQAADAYTAEAQKRAEQAERERNAMHAAAEELRAQGAVLPEAHSGRTSGEPYAGWVFQRKRCGHVSATPQKVCPECGDDDGTTVPLRTCNGTGRKTEESDGKTEEAHGGQRSSTSVQPGGQHDHRCQSTPSHLQEVSGDPGVGEAQQAAASKVRPLGVPASATIWAEVVDGLGRKVGAWFVSPFMKGDLGHVDMYDPEQPSAPWAWSPRCDSQWKGSFDERLTPSAAAQCRQLYEKGLAHLAAEATHQALAGDDPGPIADGLHWERRPDGTEVLRSTRPACIPSHIADTDWNVIEGRAVWRGERYLVIQGPPNRTCSVVGRGDVYSMTCDSFRADVPESLFLAARRWMGWEKEETAQGPVPRAAMWNVVGDGAFAEPFGTIRKCAECGCLVAGGPTRCGRCAEGGAP